MPNLSPPPGEFYIGYAPVTPRKLAVFRGRVICLLALLAVCLAGSIVLSQQPFVGSLFEFLEYRKFRGIVEEQPYPTLYSTKWVRALSWDVRSFVPSIRGRLRPC